MAMGGAVLTDPVFIDAVLIDAVLIDAVLIDLGELIDANIKRPES